MGTGTQPGRRRGGSPTENHKTSRLCMNELTDVPDNDVFITFEYLGRALDTKNGGPSSSKLADVEYIVASQNESHTPSKG
jgi:hypothetical protein